VVAGVVVAAAIAALAAVMVGEYEIDLWLGLAMGALTGLAVGEAIGGIGRSRNPVLALIAAGLAAGSVAWAGSIDAGGFEPIHTGVWFGAALGALVAWWRVRSRVGELPPSSEAPS
jgi:hypothetical protein